MRSSLALLLLLGFLPLSLTHLALEFRGDCFDQLSEGLFVSCNDDDNGFVVASFLYADDDELYHTVTTELTTDTVVIGQHQLSGGQKKQFDNFEETLSCCAHLPGELELITTRDVHVHASPAMHRWTVEELLQIIHAGVDPWIESLDEQTDTFYAFSVHPYSSGSVKDLSTLNNANEILFAAITGDLIPNPEKVLAVAFYYVNRDVTRILEWSIALNVHRLSSFFDLEKTGLHQRGFDIRTIMKHEFGHTFALGHAKCKLSIMYSTLSEQEIRWLIMGDTRCVRVQHGLPLNPLTSDGMRTVYSLVLQTYLFAFALDFDLLQE